MELSINRGQNREAGPDLASLKPEQIRVSGYTDPDDYNPHNVRPWIIGNQFGALCLVFASHEQEAFNVACDENQLAGLAITQDDLADMHDDEIMYLGNASEPFESTHAWIREAELTGEQWGELELAYESGLDDLQWVEED